MSIHAQDTDGANSAPMITAKNVDGSGKPKTLVSRSSQDISGDDGASNHQPTTDDAITAPFSGGDQ